LRQIGLDPGNGPDPSLVADGFRERAETLLQLAESCRYCYEDFTSIDEKAARKHLRPEILVALMDFAERLAEVKHWQADSLGRELAECADAHGLAMGKLGQPVRVAVTGGSVSPPIDVTLALVGRERSIARIKSAIGLIKDARADA
jgi:glutamyl-tRNA synthetase